MHLYVYILKQSSSFSLTHPPPEPATLAIPCYGTLSPPSTNPLARLIVCPPRKRPGTLTRGGVFPMGIALRDAINASRRVGLYPVLTGREVPEKHLYLSASLGILSFLLNCCVYAEYSSYLTRAHNSAQAAKQPEISVNINASVLSKITQIIVPSHLVVCAHIRKPAAPAATVARLEALRMLCWCASKAHGIGTPI